MISDEEQRVFFDFGGGALVDQTTLLNNFRAGTVTGAILSTGYIYIGQVLPFAHKYFHIITDPPISNTASLTVEYWAGDQWIPTVDLRDGTGAGGDATKTMSQSGYIKFRPDPDEQGWQADDTDEMDGSGLENGPRIPCMYWARLSFSASLSAQEFNYIGQKFSNDDEMYSWYPGLNNQRLRDTYEQDSPAGTKTDWEEQSFMSAEMVVRDLKQSNIIISQAQLMDTDLFNLESIHKQAEIIFGGVDRRGPEDEGKAHNRWKKARELARKNIDENGDGKLSKGEQNSRQFFAGR